MHVRNDFYSGLRAALPTVLGYLGIGMAFGLIATAGGLSSLEVLLMSLLVYAGSAQFALVGLLAAETPLLSIALTIFLINLRNFLMGLHTATLFPNASLGQGVAIGSLLTDETYGVLLGESHHGQNLAPEWMLGNNLLSYLSWVTASLLGALLGTNLPDPETLGLDYALLAMFIGIFVAQYRGLSLSTSHGKILKLLSLVAVAYLSFAGFLPSSVAVLLATICGCLSGVYTDDK